MTGGAALQTALARISGQAQGGALQDPLGQDPLRNAAVADAPQLLVEMDKPEALYRYPVPFTPGRILVQAQGGRSDEVTREA